MTNLIQEAGTVTFEGNIPQNIKNYIETNLPLWVEEAHEKYGVLAHGLDAAYTQDLWVTVNTDCRGTSGGTAKAKRSVWRGMHSLEVSLNPQIFSREQHEILNTIRHEFAHILVYHWSQTTGRKMQPHGFEWKLMCKITGCNANRTHRMPLQATRKHREFLYAVGGFNVKLKTVRHNRVQKGTVYVYNGKYRVTKDNFVKEV